MATRRKLTSSSNRRYGQPGVIGTRSTGVTKRPSQTVARVSASTKSGSPKLSTGSTTAKPAKVVKTASVPTARGQTTMRSVSGTPKARAKTGLKVGARTSTVSNPNTRSLRRITGSSTSRVTSTQRAAQAAANRRRKKTSRRKK